MTDWTHYVEGRLPNVVLNRVLYRTGVGRICKAWLDLKTYQVFTNVPIKAIGPVPKKFEQSLPDTGYELTKIGPIPM